MFARPSVVLELIWVVWLCSWVAASFWSGRTQKKIATLETWTYRAAMIAGGILLVPWTTMVLGEKPIWQVGAIGTYTLAAVMVAGLAFTWWGRIYLGRLWSSVITRKEDHRIIDTGPYAIVRHRFTGLLSTTGDSGRRGTLSGLTALRSSPSAFGLKPAPRSVS